MDCTRSSKRMGASRVTCVYRRRTEDMTALPDEIEGAVEEGCEIMTMSAPVRIELDDGDNVTGLVVQPQIPGAIDKSGRPRPVKADLPEVIIPCDIVIVAIGQGVDSKEFEEAGIPLLILDGDGCDRSHGGEGQTATRLEAFLEMLGGEAHE